VFVSVLHSFSLVTAWHKNLGAKAACKMLMKLTARDKVSEIIFSDPSSFSRL